MADDSGTNGKQQPLPLRSKDLNAMAGLPTYQLPPRQFQSLARDTLVRGRYRVEGQLGQGGMGFVYGVRDEGLANARPLRALKEMIPRVDDHEHQKTMTNFAREAEVLEALRHERIPRIYDYFEEFRRAYLVLEYVEGRTLETVLDQSPGPLAPQVVGEWIVQLCEIVDYLHSRNPPVIFRDLKLSNVMLTPLNQIFLIDFGIAKVFQRDELNTNVGTRGYAAPEQYAGRAETRSDVYALGVMAHHLLTKNDPRLEEQFTFFKRPPRKYNPSVSADLEVVIMKALSYTADDRYQSAADFRQALVGALHMPDTGYIRRTGISHLTGRGQGSGVPAAQPGRSPRLLWTFAAEEEVRATPTVANGLLYVGSYDNNLYALDLRTGRYRWRHTAEGGICGQAAIWQNLVIFGAEDFYVYGVDATTGEERWKYRTHNHVRSTPRVVGDRVYIGSDDAYLHAIDPRVGRPYWRFQAYREIRSTPAVANNLVYFGCSDETFYAVDAAEGEKKWSVHTQGPIISAPVVAEGNVYFGSMDFGVYALDAKSGWQAWREPTDKMVVSSPCIVGDRLFIGSSDMHLYCLDRRTGRVVWKYHAGQQVNSNPAYANGVVYIGSLDGMVHAVSADTGKQLWHFPTKEKVCGSPIVHEGVVYIGSSDWSVYALEIP